MKTHLKLTLPLNRQRMLGHCAKYVAIFVATVAACFLRSNAFAAAGDLYVTDSATNSIIVFAPDGTQRTFATGLNNPQGIVFDQAKNLYVADAGSGNIFMYDLAGNQTTFFTGLSDPIGLALDGGDLLVSENGANQVTRLPLDHMPPRTLFETVTAPLGLTSHSFPPQGSGPTRYIAHENSLLEVDSTGAIINDIDLGVGTRSVGAILRTIPIQEDDVFITTDAGTILELVNDSTTPITFASGLSQPYGMDFRPARFSGDPDNRIGNLYVADQGSGEVLQFTPDGLPSTFVSGVGSPNFMVFEVQSAPVITSVLSATATKGQPFSYQITATNLPTSFNATGLPGGLTVDTATGLISGTPTVIGTFSVNLSATNGGGTGTAVLTLTVKVQSSPPVITSVLSVTATKGQPFSYQITATNSPTSFNATALPGGLTVDTTTGLISGTPTVIGTFSVNLTATNTAGTGSAVLTLTVEAQSSSPVITSSLSATAAKGQPFSYQITATNSPRSFNATGLPAGLTVNTTTGLISGTPTVIGTFLVNLSATNASGTGTAALTLNVGSVPLTVLLQNISTRAQVSGTGDDVLIGGLIISGGDVSTLKTVAIRALGPSLAGAGVSGVLADPVLELHEPDGTVVTNKDWVNNNAANKAIIIARGLNQYNGGTISNLESIIIANLPSVDPTIQGSGQYTAVVTDTSGGTGVALVEVYDLDDPATSTTQLANISSRGFVGTGDNVMIGGLIVGPAGNLGEVILRAIGPSLSGAGVADPLANPTMTLVDANANQLATNNNWKTNTTADRQTIIDNGLDQYNGGTISDLESVIVANLTAGEYTAIVSGVNGTTGVGLVEVYHIATPAAK